MIRAHLLETVSEQARRSAASIRLNRFDKPLARHDAIDRLAAVFEPSVDVRNVPSSDVPDQQMGMPSGIEGGALHNGKKPGRLARSVRLSQ